MVEQYSCAACYTINSAYDIACRSCGVEPASDYVKEHKEEIFESYDTDGGDNRIMHTDQASERAAQNSE